MDDITTAVKKRHKRLQTLQQTNIDVWLGDSPKQNSSTLDPNLKKNMSFIKRCRVSIGQDNASQLLREISLLKLEKYTSEIVGAVTEGVLRCKTTNDFQAAADVLSALHARFSSGGRFILAVLKKMLKPLTPPSLSALDAMSPEQREREEQARLARQKTLLRIVGEMYLSGLLWGIDAMPEGVDGFDLASAFTLSNLNSSSTNDNSKFEARVKEMVSQPGHCVLIGALQNLLLVDRERHLSIFLATAFARSFKTDLMLVASNDEESSEKMEFPIPVNGSNSSGSEVITDKSCKKIKSLLHDYADSALQHLKSEHNTLVQMRKNAQERMFTKGIVHADTKEKIDRQAKTFETLNDSVVMLCESLGITAPQFVDHQQEDNEMGIVFDGTDGDNADGSKLEVWQDEEERNFYEAVLDLKSELPSFMLVLGNKRKKAKEMADAAAATEQTQEDEGAGQEAMQKVAEDDEEGLSDIGEFNDDDIKMDESYNVDGNQQNGTNRGEDDGNEDGEEEDDGADGFTAVNGSGLSGKALGLLEYQKFISERKRDVTKKPVATTPASNGQQKSVRPDGASRQKLPDTTTKSSLPVPLRSGKVTEDPKIPNGESKTTEAMTGDGETSANTKPDNAPPMSFNYILRRLLIVSSKADVDELAVNFCYVNSKKNRVELIRTLVNVSRKQLYLVPFYARFLATLHPYFPEIGQGVLEELDQEFRWLVKQKFKDLLSTRLKNIRYICELTKFRVAPLHIPVRCAKLTLENFHKQNIEVLCALLEGCGRFLLTRRATSSRMASLLEVLVRKKRALNLDDRTNLLIENACLSCTPKKKRMQEQIKYRTPYERYIRKLIYEDLSRNTTDRVIQKLRKLPWDDGTGDDPMRVRHTLLNCFTKVWKVKYANVYLLTMVAGVLGRLHSWFRVAIVDTAFENIKLGLECNEFSRNQRRIAEVRYVGEMLIYKIIEPRGVIELLHLLLRFGHVEPHPMPGRSCAVDASDDYFRIRLVCTLLSTCGSYIRDAEGLKSIQQYAMYFQMYILAKDQPLPVDIDFNLDTLYETVFPNVKRYNTWEEAAQAMNVPVSTDLQVVPPEMATEAPSSEQQLPSSTIENSVTENNSNNNYQQNQLEADEDGTEQMKALEAMLDQEEEDDLERELNKMMIDSTDIRRPENRSNKLDMSVPMHLVDTTSNYKMDTMQTTDAMRFSLLMGKKHRPAVRGIDVPMESQMVRNIREQRRIAQEEKDSLKRFVLNYERQEAEEQQRVYDRQYEEQLTGRVTGGAGSPIPDDNGLVAIQQQSVSVGRWTTDRGETSSDRHRHGGGGRQRRR